MRWPKTAYFLTPGWKAAQTRCGKGWRVEGVHAVATVTVICLDPNAAVCFSGIYLLDVYNCLL